MSRLCVQVFRLELIGNAAQHVPTHRIKLPIRVEEANDPLHLLEGLNSIKGGALG
jgi:hypothetical protein